MPANSKDNIVDHLVTETRNNASIHLDLLSAEGLVHLMCSEDSRIPKAIAACAPTVAKVIEKITERMRNGGRLIYMGAGTSGRLGVLDATECPPTFSVPTGLVIGLIAGGERALTTAVEGAEDHPEFGMEDLKQIQITANDSVVGIATSGRTPYVAGGLDYARSLGAYTVAFSCNPHAEINTCAEDAIGVVVGPEILTGSTRLKSGTAT
ncbi:N-acetylmuramic acid 6-phosphate etherase, partial [bacterium]|nr:N-acetylmuramic acid 6-phosphate etherase [bacterium]